MITNFEQKAPNLVSIWWTDDRDPNGRHVLYAYAGNGTKQQKEVTGSPQDISFTPGTPYCFEIAGIGDTTRYSEAKCVNGADATVLVVHDTP